MSRPDPSRPAPGLVAALAGAGYEVVALAGRGGSGSVWRAVTGEGAAVAVKVLDRGEQTERLRREAQVLGSVDHPAVPAIIDVLDVEGRPVLITEWADGTSLADLLASGPLAPQRAVAIFAGLADALDHVHRQGLAHRDISPDNVLIGGDVVSLIDFGLTRSADSATVTAEGMTAGTPRYVAPEVLAGAPAGPRSDIYAAAMVFHEMLTGRWAYDDPGETIASVLHHHLHGVVVPPGEVHPWLTSFDAVVERGLARAPEDRFESMAEMRAALPVLDAPAPERATSAGRRTALAALVAGLALLIAGIAAIVALSGDDPSAANDVEVGHRDGWPSGAAALGCNLLDEADFESGVLPANFYDGVADRNDIVDFGGVGQSAALRVGVSGDYGLYGETVPITGGPGYVFSAHVAPTTDVQAAIVRVYTLDADRALIAAEPGGEIGADEVEVNVPPGSSGRISVVIDETSPEARFAVPSIVKEGAAGFIVADELVFAALGTECDPPVDG